MTYKDNKKSIVFDSKEGYDKYAKLYDKKLEFLNSFEKNMLMKMAGDVKGKKVLDIGCGTGRLARVLIEKNADYTGVDISEEMLKIAKKKNTKGKFLEADIEELPFEDESFDVIICAFVIVHVGDLKEAFREAYRVLKKGGIFVVTNINQKKAPKLFDADGFPLYITSYYHIPKHVISALEEAFFTIEDEDFINEKAIWINQIVKAVKS